jgi:hypothetical protein
MNMSGETFDSVYIKRFGAWAPGIRTREDWKRWAQGVQQIAHTTESPALEFTSPLFRRRLSQISRMTIQVMRDLLPFSPCAKQLFFSYRGEITSQLKINRALVAEGSINPAPFSLSVFNAPVALASIALGLRAGYTAIYPSRPSFDAFHAAVQTAAALVSGGADECGETVFCYADELVPAEYGALFNEAENEPLSFAVLLSAKPESGGIPLSEAVTNSPRNFIAKLFANDL